MAPLQGTSSALMDTLEKIRPTRIEDIVGNRAVVKRFLEHIKNGCKPRYIALVGPTGCGKSLVCDLVFKHLGLKCLDITSKESIIGCKDTLSSCLLDGNKVYLIDNVDALINTDKNVITAIKGTAQLLKNATMVLTCRPCALKEISTRLKGIEVFALGYPPIRDAFIYLSGCIDGDEERMLSLAKAYRGNIREIVMNMHQASHETSMTVQDRGFKEYNVFDIASCFLVNPRWELIDPVTRVEPDLVSYIVYENIIEEAHCRDPDSVMTTYLTSNRYMVDAANMERRGLGDIVHFVRFGGMLVSLAKGSSHFTNIKFPKAGSKNRTVQKVLNSTDIPIMDIIDLVDSGKMENCFPPLQ